MSSLTPVELDQFSRLFDAFRDKAGRPPVALSEAGQQVCEAHCISMVKRKRLALTRSFSGERSLRACLGGESPLLQYWIVGQGTTSPQVIFKAWASALDNREILLSPRIDFYGIARCEAYWTFVAYREKQKRDYRKKL